MTRAAPILLLLAACAATPPPQAPTPLAGAGLADPVRQAVLGAGWAFATPGRLAGRPAEAAVAAAQVEELAANLPGDQRWIGANLSFAASFGAARTELRGAIGLRQDAAGDAAERALRDAGAALRTGDDAAAAAALAPVSPAPAVTLARLAALPPLPRTAAATRVAQTEMRRLEGDDPL